jgi:hypothetical protein
VTTFASEIDHVRLLIALLTTLVGTLAYAQVEGLPPEAVRLIEQAGNTEDELQRLDALDKLATGSLGESLTSDARTLAALVRLWNPQSGRLNFFIPAFGREAQSTFKEYDLKIPADSPLRPIAELYRGRMLAWYLIESGNLRGNSKLGLRYKEEALRSFRIAERAFPRNRIPGAYQGRPIPWPKSYAPLAGAPTWAVLQREHLDRFRDIIYWWIDHRQQADGSFGGGWGDDCEMRRWWTPLLLSFDDPKIISAQARFSIASLSRPEMQDGFLSQVRDVEHSAEDSTDNLIPLLMLQPDESRWQDQSRNLTDLVQRVWTGRNGRGELQFRSFFFGANEISPAPEYACDVIGNVLAVSPALYVWQQTRDPGLGRPLTAWLDTWVAATARAENGKPAGILPAAIHWPDGQVAGAENRWWEPLPLSGGGMAHYYVWPSVLSEMTDALLTAHLVTGNEKYLAPIRSMAAIRLKYLKEPPQHAPPGSESWCAAGLGPSPSAHVSKTSPLVRTLARCRTLTGTREFDELIALDGPEYASGAESRPTIEAALRSGIEILRYNFPCFTGEVRYTDRVLSFGRFLALSESTDGMTATLPRYDLVYRMVSGDENSGRIPMPAVRWRTPPQDIAAWVASADQAHLEAELFHFGDQPRPMSAELRLLSPGRYRVELLHRNPPAVAGEQRLEVKGPLARIGFSLPPQTPCTIRISAEKENQR